MRDKLANAISLIQRLRYCSLRELTDRTRIPSRSSVGITRFFSFEYKDNLFDRSCKRIAYYRRLRSVVRVSSA